jgi:hypothetical protein
MNDRAGANRAPQRAGALAIAAAVAVLAAACSSGTPSSSSSTSPESATYRAELAFVQCMRAHGAPSFPDPSPGQGITIHESANATGPKAQAYNACKYLLPRGSTTTPTGHITTQQFNQAVKIAQCIRSHGEPTFPDPTLVNGSAHFNIQAGVVGSTQFQAAENACRSLIPKGVSFP